jgi:poly-beta-1,6-N-acetyl-D-glucosamine synthase
MIEDLNFLLIDTWFYISQQFKDREAWDWLMFFFPFVAVIEGPRYIIPVIVMPILRWIGFTGGDDKYLQEEFLKTNPRVSIIVAGRNEEEIIGRTIDSLLELPYKNKEIIVIDDASDDNMFEICEAYAKKGLIRLFKNESQAGRTGRPVASNLGLKMSTGEFIISVDADTSYDRDTIPRMIGPFHNPKVGGVAGNLKTRNQGASIWADFQALEYMISIGLWKRWTSMTGATTQASGAFGAFRKEALMNFYGWDPELAEDADLTLKVYKSGWEIAFSPGAIAMTSVPENLRTLISQRVRWDKGTIRTYFHKHKNIFMFWKFGFGHFFELGQEFLLFYVSTLLYPIYMLYMGFKDWKFLLFAYAFCYLLYAVLSFFTILVAVSFSERKKYEWWMLWYTPLFPFYKEIFRWVRLRACLEETFRIDYQESYIPESGYKKSSKW